MDPEQSAHIIVKEHSPRAVIDRAFSAMSEVFSSMVQEHLRRSGDALDATLRASGCRNLSLTKQFILEGAPSPTGIDVERVLSHIGASQTFAERVPVTIGSEIMFFEPACGTAIDANGEMRHAHASEVPENFDRLVRRILSINSWFFWECSQRYLNARDGGAGEARLPPPPAD